MALSKEPSSKIYKEEKDLLKAVKDWLEPQERDGIKLIRISNIHTRGYSDLFICVRGWFVVAELKDDIGQPTKQQLDFIRDMKAAGAIGGVCRSVKDVSDLIEEAKRRVSYVSR
jgi:DNA-binding PucR family transcriptional regulator